MKYTSYNIQILKFLTNQHFLMEVAYVIGPYRNETAYGTKKNIQKAEQLAEELWRLGYAAFCPHSNSAFLSGLVPEQQFLEGGIEFLRRCDLAVTVEGWENSQGSLLEIKICKENNIPIFYSLEELKQREL